MKAESDVKVNIIFRTEQFVKIVKEKNDVEIQQKVKDLEISNDLRNKNEIKVNNKVTSKVFSLVK